MMSPARTPDHEVEEFAAKVAHDFNNMLTGILGHLELLQRRAARDQINGLESFLEGANQAALRAASFAARLMDYSGQATCPPESVRLDAFLTSFAPRAICGLAAPGANLSCDPVQLELAFTELLANAHAAGGQVFIDSTRADGQAIVTVRDTGHGMAPDILARATEPFFTTHTNGTGRGLGLSIVARVVRDAGGVMDIQSQEGAGCAVTVRLPCC